MLFLLTVGVKPRPCGRSCFCDCSAVITVVNLTARKVAELYFKQGVSEYKITDKLAWTIFFPHKWIQNIFTEDTIAKIVTFWDSNLLISGQGPQSQILMFANRHYWILMISLSLSQNKTKKFVIFPPIFFICFPWCLVAALKPNRAQSNRGGGEMDGKRGGRGHHVSLLAWVTAS